jgi:hypothetical protein
MTEQTTPRTSVSTYNATVAELRLGGSPRMVYDVLYQNPNGLTRGEQKAKIESLIDFKGATAPWVNTLYALKAMGVVEVIGERICSQTGNPCQVWATTDKLPKRIKPVKGLEKPEFEEVQVALELLVETAGIVPDSLGAAFKHLQEWVAYKASLPE